MDQEFSEIVKRNKPFFTKVNRLIATQIQAAVPLRLAITNVIDNPSIWPVELSPESRAAMIAFYEEVFTQAKRN